MEKGKTRVLSQLTLATKFSYSGLVYVCVCMCAMSIDEIAI